MRLPINQVARGIGMQNQYLALAVCDGKVEGEVPPSGDWHSDLAVVELSSVRHFLATRYENGIISQDAYIRANQFLNDIGQ